MNYADAAYIAASEIPVIDMAPLVDGSDVAGVAARMLGAVTGIGFFYVKNHPIPEPVIARARAAPARFFSLPEEVKARVAINRYHRGFLGMGDARMPGSKRADYKESFVWGLEPTPGEPAPGTANPFRTPNLWPESLPELREDLAPFLEHAQVCAIHLMQAFAVGLGARREAFLGSSTRPISRASIVHYPPQPAELGEQQFGVGAHTDFGCLTVLCQDEVGGLQVLNAADEWGCGPSHRGDAGRQRRRSHGALVERPLPLDAASGRQRLRPAPLLPGRGLRPRCRDPGRPERPAAGGREPALRARDLRRLHHGALRQVLRLPAIERIE